jgi:mannose-6-phosphate isomerase-like protein (cupin superfamily)
VERRIEAVGRYELLQDYSGPQMSIRILRLRGGEESVQRHVHYRSAQVYVAILGRVVVERDGEETVIEPYETAEVPPGTIHGARPLDDEAIVANISVPPLAPDDQIPASRLEAQNWG